MEYIPANLRMMRKQAQVFSWRQYTTDSYRPCCHVINDLRTEYIGRTNPNRLAVEDTLYPHEISLITGIIMMNPPEISKRIHILTVSITKPNLTLALHISNNIVE